MNVIAAEGHLLGVLSSPQKAGSAPSRTFFGQRLNFVKMFQTKQLSGQKETVSRWSYRKWL